MGKKISQRNHEVEDLFINEEKDLTSFQREDDLIV